MSRMIPRKNNKFSGLFEDSDDEIEHSPDILEAEVNFNLQSRYNSAVQNYQSFINNPDFITGSGDQKTNIVDMYTMFQGKITTKTYCIPDNKLSKFFKYIEICRRTDGHMMVYEKQQEYSGIMLDFDVYQNTSTKYLNDGIMQSITQVISTIIKTYINLSEPDIPYNSDIMTIYFAFIVKPEIKYNVEKDCYKDGFHILIPGVKIKREVKRLIIRGCMESKALAEILGGFDLHEDYADKIIDKDAAHVPIFLLGSSSKPNTPPYKLTTIKSVTIRTDKLNDIDSHNVVQTDDVIFKIHDNESPVVLAHELSINWENNHRVKPLIEKRRYEVKEEFLSELEIYSKNKENTDDPEFGELSILNIHDPDAEYIKKLLDTMSPFRYTDFDPWFKVLCALAHTSKSYKTLAEEFSMKCIEKYNQHSFEQHWNSALENKTSKLGIGSLHFWAKLDNPVKYEEIRHHSIYDIVLKKIYDPQLEGSLQHYDIAKILQKSLTYKYVYDSSDGGVWYEFILEGDLSRQGGIYKWRAINNSRGPNSMKIYMSEVLPSLFAKITAKISATIENEENESKAKYHSLVKHNVNLMTRRLRDSSFKNSVIREAEQVFEKVEFGDKLDKDPDIIGVGNGILKLGPQIQLITGFHNYLVSKFTPVIYKEFNPYDPVTRKLLYVIRNLFTDDEPDSFEFLIYYLASSLDFHAKPPLLVMLIGSGRNAKSFLMELHRETLADYSLKMDMAFLTSRAKSAETASPAMMALESARFVYYSEPRIGEELNMGKVKEVTGGEAMPGRKLFGDFKNIIPNCIHLTIGNNEFDVVGDNTYGTWRRIKKICFRIKFCTESETPDPDNKLEKKGDSSIGMHWKNDPEVKSAYLSILCYYYEILQSKFNGNIENVPHPNIEKETEDYHNRQDKVNRFINIRFVKTVDPDIVIPLSTVVEKYTKWHDSLYPDDKSYRKTLAQQLENSKLNKILTKTKVGIFIKGYRILDNNEEPEDGEQYLMDVFIDKQAKYKIIESESPDEYYTRICEEYEVRKRIKEEFFKKENELLYKQKLKEQKEAKKREQEENERLQRKREEINKQKALMKKSSNKSDSSDESSDEDDSDSSNKKSTFIKTKKLDQKSVKDTRRLVAKDLDDYNSAGFNKNIISKLKSFTPTESYLKDLTNFNNSSEASEHSDKEDSDSTSEHSDQEDSD
ncbi:MAG: PriCT-2 domain-containing protein [Cetobacterium sp.]